MDKRLRAWLEQNGLRKDASNKEAWAKYRELRGRSIVLEGFEDAEEPAGSSGGEGESHRGAASTPPPPAMPLAPPADNQPGEERQEEPLDPAVQAQINDAVRQQRIEDANFRTSVCSRMDVAGFVGPEHEQFRGAILNDPNMTEERATNMIFERMQSHNPAVGAGAASHFSVGTEDREKFRNAVEHGLMLRSGIRIETPAAGSNEFRGYSLIEIGRELLGRAGVNTRGMRKMDVAGYLLSGRALGGGMSSSDFPLIMGNLVNRTLLQVYQEWPQTWKPWVSITDAQDFRDINAIRMSGSPDLEEMTESGEYKSASFSEAGETYRVITKGRTTRLTRTMIVNDDLRAFTKIPRLFGSAARRMEGDAVYSLVTSNPLMKDGVALFAAGHKNLEGKVANKGAVNTGNLSAGRSAMRLQKGLGGEALDVTPAFLLVPVEQETDADIILMSTALPKENMSTGTHNPWAGKLTPIADPHLSASSTKAWYLVAHPDQIPTVEVAYLEGEEQPYVDEQVDFDSDSLKIKVRHDFGAGIVDHVGIYKNPGE